MIFKKYKIKRLIIRLITAAVVLALIYFAITLLGKLFSMNSSNTTELTKQEVRKQKYNEPMIGTVKIDENKIEDVVKVIDNYYTYCNEKNYEQAYAMLSEECKEVTCPTLEDFKERVDKTFDKLKLYRYKSVINFDNQYIYKISLYDDIMAYGSSEFPTEKNYYIVINDNGENNYTISLDALMKKTNLKYKVTTNDLQIVVDSKETYYNKTKVNYTITNNSSEVMVISSNVTKLVMKEDTKEKDYTSNNISFGDNYIYVMPGMKLKISTLFEVSNIYDSETLRIEFNDIFILPYEFYEQNEFEIDRTQLEENYTQKFNMQIPL